MCLHWGCDVPNLGVCPILGLYLRARSAGGTLGTRSAGVTLLPGFSLLAFGTGLSVGTLMGTAATTSGVRTGVIT